MCPARAVDSATIQFWSLFIGNQENVGLRFGGAIGILFTSSWLSDCNQLGVQPHGDRRDAQNLAGSDAL